MIKKRKKKTDPSTLAGRTEWWVRNRRLIHPNQQPQGCDRSMTLFVYKLAHILTKALGVKCSVDHVVPLKHPLVCGLHWHHNLKVELLADNLKKGNKFEV